MSSTPVHGRVKTALVLLLMAVCRLRGAANVDDRVENALDRLLDHILENSRRIRVDGLFGVVLTQVHLAAVLDEARLERERRRVQRLKEKADLIYAIVKPQLYNGDGKQLTFVEKIVDPYLWQREIEFHHGLISPNPPAAMASSDGGGDRIRTHGDYMSYLSTSNMSESQSDECLLQLIATDASRCRHESRLTDMCRLLMIKDPYYDPAYGVTHRLLYLQIGRNTRRLCTVSPEWYHEQAQKYCSYILWEAVTNARFGFLDELDDILLEQMTLCGYEGFGEFLTDAFVGHVLDAQTAHGCYGIPMRVAAPEAAAAGQRRRRRSANLLPDGCNDHTTGLAASTLALVLRHRRAASKASAANRTSSE